MLAKNEEPECGGSGRLRQRCCLMVAVGRENFQ